MDAIVVWSGREYHSIEHCALRSTEYGLEARSVVVGFYDGEVYRVDYLISLNDRWETQRCEINYHVNHIAANILLQRVGGQWTLNEKPMPEFTNCIDVDIPITPFTNTLPINRLQLSEKESRQIDVIYFDVLSDEIKVVRQKYKRINATQYKYENVPIDFEAVISVDENGLVEDYPGLFVRTAIG